MKKIIQYFVLFLFVILFSPSIASACNKNYCDYKGSTPDWVYSSTYTCGKYFLGERVSGCGRTLAYRDFRFYGVYDEQDNHYHVLICPYCGELKYIFITKIKSSPRYLPGASCFIATAAFGTSFSKEVEILREFRDTYLISNSLGRLFVSIYYKISPPIANFIAKSETRRAITRKMLTPIVKIVKMTIHEKKK